ncbi:MAG: hypothetical protein HQ564_10465 [Candidatus Saganbacteria bacterium]|nr:hypothetical protein [Candidatus Saganbacteria bacterium]
MSNIDEVKQKTEDSLKKIDQFLAELLEKHKPALTPKQLEYHTNICENQKELREKVSSYFEGKFPKEWVEDKGILIHKLVSSLARVNQFASLVVEGIAGPVEEGPKVLFANIVSEAKNLEIILRNHVKDLSS